MNLKCWRSDDGDDDGHVTHTMAPWPCGRAGDKRLKSSCIYYFCQEKESVNHIVFLQLWLSIIIIREPGSFQFSHEFTFFTQYIHEFCIWLYRERMLTQNHIEKIVEKPASQTAHHQPLSRRQSHNVNVEDIIAQQVTRQAKWNFHWVSHYIPNGYRFKIFHRRNRNSKRSCKRRLLIAT